MIRPAAKGEFPPVLYLDLDDTIVSWADGSPRRAPGVTAFLSWALERYEVRWLTTWCPGGRMEARLLADLTKLTGVPSERLRRVRGVSWDGGSKLDGIAWLEHVVLRRPFLWVEDGSVRPEALRFLARHGFADRFRHCDVTRDPYAVLRLHRKLAASEP